MEQRQYQRVRFFSKAHLDVAGHSYPTEVLDLSLKGALVRKPAMPLPATDLPLRLRLQLAADFGYPPAIQALASLAPEQPTASGD